ncbi:non-ribosomal peptide synthetase, partial [Photobacterium minamisatsumaniensis]|uniref:non-ribosomal peptide synthetase n=1 Tax=Photobacterium minamisatsumaniensis TaxID=2910233 RepID=UPI003D129878
MQQQTLPPVIDGYPLSRMQAGMHYHNQLNTHSSLYHDVFNLQLQTRWDQAAFTQAIEQTLSQHPLLRTSFNATKFSEPMQLVHQQGIVRLEVRQLTDKPTADVQIESAINQLKASPLSLTEPSQIRFTVLLRESGQFQLLIDAHHMILDGWSMATLLTELFQRYLIIQGLLPEIPDQPLQSNYKAFIKAERKCLKDEVTRQYWQQQLAAFEYHELPSLRPDNERPGGMAEWRSALPRPLINNLAETAKSHGLRLTSLLQAAHLRVIGLLTNRTDTCSTTVANGRLEKIDGERVIGLFINSLPLAIDLVDHSWLSLAQAIEAQLQQHQPYRRYPFAELVKQHATPLSDFGFNYTHFHIYKHVQDIRGFNVINGEIREENSFKFHTSFHQGLTGDINLALSYQQDYISNKQAQAAGQYYLTALQHICQTPNAKCLTTPLLEKRERERMLYHWNPPSTDTQQNAFLHQRVEQQAKHNPSSIAAYCAGHALTYQALNERANQLAHRLRQEGIGPDQFVGLYVDRSLEMLIGLLGIMKAGGAYLPLDPQYPTERIEYMLADTNARLVLTQHHLEKQLPAGEYSSISLDDKTELTHQPCTNLSTADIGLKPNHLAYIIYTSGSTGKPKGVMLEHRNLSNFLSSMAQQPGLADDDTLLAVTSISFDIHTLELYLPLQEGGTVVIATREQTLDSQALDSLIQHHNVTAMQATPATWTMLTQQQWRAPSGFKAMCGGEALTQRLQDSLLNLPGLQLWNMYGPTETCVWSAVSEVTHTAPARIGTPIANTTFYILDPQGHPVPQGVAGELFIGGDGLARGYHNRPDLTAERFINHPAPELSHERIYQTGDLVRRLDSGELEFIGRTDFQVKLRGFRIELGEIETCLLQHPSFNQAVVQVAGKPEKLVAYLVTGKGVEGQSAILELKKHAQQYLPAYMQPSVYQLLDNLPLTPNGKINRKALADIPLQTNTLSIECVAPRNETEQQLAIIWQEALETTNFGVRDNFFELGGDSILSVQVVAKAEQAGLLFTVADMFEHQTIEQLVGIASQTPSDNDIEEDDDFDLISEADAELLTRKWKALPYVAGQYEKNIAIQPPVIDGYPLSRMQAGMHYHNQLNTHHSLYHDVLNIQLQACWDQPAFTQAIEQTLNRHPLLRTSFNAIAFSEPMQLVHQQGIVRLDVRQLATEPSVDI